MKGNLKNHNITRLEINKYVLEKTTGTQYVYDLFGVSNHYGSVGGGHYTATCYNYSRKKWYDFNDSSVGPATN